MNQETIVRGSTTDTRKNSEFSGKLITNWADFLEQRKKDFVESMSKKVLRNPDARLSDFLFHKTLGKGGFASVYLVERKQTGLYYAAKLQEKQFLVEHRQVKNILNEKKLLESFNFPFTLRMEFFFQDNVYLYFIMPVMGGGDIFSVLRKKGKLDEHLSRFYAAQVLLALEYMHFLDLVYRDIKPENILIDREGYITVADYGFVKYVKNRTYTFCGTPEYIAPEIIESKGYGKAVDYWAFGILLYEFNSGITPFYSSDPMKIYEKITQGKFHLNNSFSGELKDIIQHLLQVNLSRRYGNLKGGVDDIKAHQWFKKIIWMAVVNKAIKPPFVPVAEEFNQHQEDIIIKTHSYDPYEEAFAEF